MRTKTLFICFLIALPGILLIILFVYPDTYYSIQSKLMIRQWEVDYNKALESGQVNYTHLRNMATKLETEGKYDEAINLWETALKKKPKDILALTRIAILFFVKSDNGKNNKGLFLKKAMDYLQESEIIAKDNPMDLAQVGRVYEIMGKYDKAIAYYEEAIDGIDKIGKINKNDNLTEQFKSELMNSINTVKKKMIEEEM